jgi:beta-1,4-N-acetylglucosaminyltransferase
MLQLLEAVDFTRYTPRVYFVSDGDTLSVQKAIALEARKGSAYSSPRNLAVRIVGSSFTASDH